MLLFTVFRPCIAIEYSQHLEERRFAMWNRTVIVILLLSNTNSLIVGIRIHDKILRTSDEQ